MLMNRILVDTNVLIYAIDEDSKYNSRTKKLLTNPKYNFYTTSKNLAEFIVVLTKAIAVPLTVKESVDLLESLTENFIILYTSKNTYRQFRKLLIKYKPRGLKIHDFEIAGIALENGINKIATINVKDFKDIDELDLIDF